MSLYDQEYVEFWKKVVKKSTIRMLILLTLVTEQYSTGFLITKQIRNRVEKLFRISAGAIYPQIKELEEQGLVNSELEGTHSSEEQPSPPRKVYHLTQRGYATTLEIQTQWELLVSIVDSYLTEIRKLNQEEEE
ncbi:MAG: PadR family transcriptional regulator [Candidatus Hermodarchaeota archaeon]